MKDNIHFLEDGYYVEQLEKENQRLKEKRDLAVQKVNEEREKNVDLEIELDKYKEVIEEVREYAKSHFKTMVADEEAQGLLQILDKIK